MGELSEGKRRDRGRIVVWRGLDAWRAESAALWLDGTRLEAEGTQIGVNPLPYRLDYELETGEDFVTSRITVAALGSGWGRRLDLRHDGAGNWTIAAEHDGAAAMPAPGGDAAQLQGALDCDLGFSPLTNLMPIQRAGLDRRPGAEDFLMAWIAVPELSVVVSAQRYEHVCREPGGAVVRFVDRGLFPGFEAELRLDREGVVVHYPELAERIEGAA